MRRRFRLVALALLARSVMFGAAELGLLALGTADGGGYLAAALAVPVLLLIAAPRVMLRGLVVPCGLPRLAYWIRLALRPIAYPDQAAGAALVYAALCMARSRDPAASLPWLRNMLNRGPIGGCSVIVAMGLGTALGGSRAEARALLAIADSKPGIPRSMRAVARDWLVADAARCGQWREVVRWGRRGRGALRWSYAMARLAERLLRHPRAGADWQLCCGCLLAPRRRATWPLLRRALSVPLPSGVVPRTPELRAPDFAHALGALAEPKELDEARLSGILDCFEQRLDELEARGAPDVAGALRQQLIELIEPLVDADPWLAGTPGAIMSCAVARRRSLAFADIEARCREYGERHGNAKPVAQLLEWQTWAMLRAALERLLVLDPEARPALFATVHVRLCNFAVYQLNILKNAALAEEMFSWLYQAAHPGSNEAKRLARNIRAAGGTL